MMTVVVSPAERNPDDPGPDTVPDPETAAAMFRDAALAAETERITDDAMAADAVTADPAMAEPTAPEPDEDLYTIDELASLTGVPSRTIRFYQSKGTLTAPERKGRVAYYRAEHVERLKVIAELQDRGLRLDAIRDALQQIENGGDSLQEWLGMGDELQAPWSDDRPVVLTEDELLERIGHRKPMIAELVRIGMIERQGHSRPATYIVSSPGMLGIGLTLEAAGVDSATAYEASQLMRRPMGKMTDELVAFFAQHAGQGFGGGGDPQSIARSYESLRPEGLRAVQLIFAQEMERSLREFVERGGAMPQARKGRPPEHRSKPSSKRPERKR